MANWLSGDEQLAWRAYLDSTRLLLQTLDRQLQRDSGLSFTDYELLVALSEAPGHQLRMRDLASRTLSTRSTVTRAVTALEKAGLVQRVDCLDDKRGVEAALTAKGIAMLRAAAPGHVSAVRAHLFDLLTEDQVARMAEQGSITRDHLKGLG